MNKVGIVIVHGIGSQRPGYSNDFVEKLRAKVGKNIELVVAEVCWQTVADPTQHKFLRWPGLSWKELRGHFATGAGDAVAYQPTPFDGGLYSQIHQCVDEALAVLVKKIGPAAPVVWVSHSLGTVISSNFLWDCYHSESMGRGIYKPSLSSKAIAMSLRHFYTLGSPLATWSQRYEGLGSPLTLPKDAKWDNVWCPADVISWPLKPINSRYATYDKLTDHKRDIGGVLVRWNPVSHLHYMYDGWVLDKIAGDIRRLY